MIPQIMIVNDNEKNQVSGWTSCAEVLLLRSKREIGWCHNKDNHDHDDTNDLDDKDDYDSW